MIERINKARALLITDQIKLETKTYNAFFFIVKEKYQVKISDTGCTCTCSYSSLWALSKNHLPCSHIIASLSFLLLEKKTTENNTK